MAQKHKQKPKYKQTTLKMHPQHTWQAPVGFKILVLERGLVSLNIPYDWIISDTNPMTLNDVDPPGDNARLSISFWPLPGGVDWSGLPLAPMLAKSLEDTRLETLERGKIIQMERDDLEMVWTFHKFIDPVEKRNAFSRSALARGFDAVGVQALLTFDFWEDDTERFQHVWDEAIRSLQLGRQIEDPTKGVTHH